MENPLPALSRNDLLNSCGVALPVASATPHHSAIMKSLTLILLSLAITSCVTSNNSGDHRQQDGLSPALPEKCRFCGGIHQYAATFDELDYSLIADFCDGFDLKKEVYWKAPHGPSPSCSSTYGSDLPWDYLHEEMPGLRRDTFDSFKRRNKPIPTHQGREEVAARYGVVITHSTSNAYRLTRGGFSSNRHQALIYSGGGVIYLYEWRESKWHQVDSCVLWIS